MHQDRVRSAIFGGMGWLREGSGLQRFWERISGAEGSRATAACIHSFGKLAVTERQAQGHSRSGGNHRRRPRSGETALRHAARAGPPRLADDVEIPDAGHITCIMQPQFKTEIERCANAHTGR